MIIDFVLVLAVLIFSIVVHEVAHGYAAHRLGDPTARLSNRLTMNPLAHVDLMGSIVVPLVLWFTSHYIFAWAKPVPFDPRYFRNPRKGIMIVGAAGPASNLGLAIVSGLLCRLVEGFNPLLGFFLSLMCATNILLCVFNLIPIPPLDGSRVLMGILPPPLAWRYAQFERYGFIVVAILAFSGILFRVIWPVVAVGEMLLMGHVGY